MGSTKTYFIALCIVVGTAGQCFAQTTGNEIQEGCQIGWNYTVNSARLISSVDAGKAGFCLGFTQAILSLGGGGGGLAEPNRFCLSEEATMGQAIRVLVKYLNEHPQLTHEDAMTLALRAFKAAWPCQ